MSIKTKFSPLGYLFPKTPQVQLTITCNINVDNIYLNGISIAQNTDTITVLVNKGLICDIYATKNGYNDSLHQNFIIYKNKTIELNLSISELETLYLTINSGEDGKFIIPFNQYRQVAYNWKIDWGDGTGWKTYSGTGTTNSGITYSDYETNHNYTIRIKNNGTTLGWLQAFGFELTVTNNDTSPSSLHNKNKVLFVNGILDKNMFTITDTLPHYTFAYMFQDCKNLKLGNNFTLPQNIINAGNYICQFMFQNCSSIDSLKTLTLPQNLIQVGENFCYGMFQNCTSLEDLSNFNLPQNITQVGINFCYKMFQDCISLESLSNLTLPQSLINMNNYTFGFMFYNCTSLNNLSNFNFPQNMTNAPQIGFAQSMFQNCTSLETLGNMKIPNITSINNNIKNIAIRVPSNFDYTLTHDKVPTYISYFEQTFMNCTSLKTGFTSFLNNWSNATQALIDYCWIIMFIQVRGDAPATHTVPFNFRVFRQMFQNCSSLQENIYPSNIKPLSFIPTLNWVDGPIGRPINETRQTFADCPQTYISTLNEGWK